MLAYFREKMTRKMSEILSTETKAIDKIKEVIDFQFKLFTTDPSIVMIIFSETSFQYENTLSEEVYEIIKHKKALMESIVHKGQMEGSIRKDLPKDQLATIIMGSMRMTVLRWRLSNFEFNLNKEGKLLTNTLQILLQGK
jgi:hypothetical protein